MYDIAHARSRTVQPMGGNLKPDLTLKTYLVFYGTTRFITVFVTPTNPVYTKAFKTASVLQVSQLKQLCCMHYQFIRVHRPHLSHPPSFDHLHHIWRIPLMTLFIMHVYHPPVTPRSPCFHPKFPLHPKPCSPKSPAYDTLNSILIN